MRPLDRAGEFCTRFGLRVPILLAPMSGVPSVDLSTAVANAGGAGACGVLMMSPDEIAAWVDHFRRGSAGPFQLNTWIPDPPPERDAAGEARVRTFLETWGPSIAPDAGNRRPPDFETQVDAMIAATPPIVSSVMGVYPDPLVRRLRAARVAWFANVTTVDEARRAEAAGADVIVAQGAEAGGHRGAFDPIMAEQRLVGLVALVPAVVDAVRVPVVAAGGIADGRGAAAALALGASAVQIGTGFLRCPEARIPAEWADALGTAAAEQTIVSRVFSGRPGRSLATAYVLAATADTAPGPAPYPVQRGLTAAMRAEAQRAGDLDRMQAWAGQSARLAKAEPAAEIVARIWSDAREILG